VCHQTANPVSIFNGHDVTWICGYDAEKCLTIRLYVSQFSELLPSCFNWLEGDVTTDDDSKDKIT
jgi:hypothetical protein